MAIYHFSTQIISRKKQRNTIAAAAYRSGEKLVDERTNESKFYNREVQPVTHILAPSHAPKWVYNRQRLWNEVEKVEKQWNGQLAREINVALPKELSQSEQEQVAIEFCSEIFVKDGMVADLAIHRDDEENPHFHVMLTIRPFNEDGTWGNKQVKIKENVNGKQQVKAIHTTDWNTKEKLVYWREQWANYANRYLEKNGFPERVTHLSNKDQGLETLPTIHEGFIARQMQSEGKESERIRINNERKEYNKVIIELAEAKKQKKIIERTEKFIRCFTPLEKKELRDSAKSLRLFINFENIKARRRQLNKWESRLEFSQDSVNTYKKLIRIERETEILNHAETILKNEANRFLDKYYPNFSKAEFSKEQKIEIVETTITQNKKLSSQEMENICRNVEKDQLQKDLYVLLNNRLHFVLSIQKEIQNIEKQFEHLRIKNGINFADSSTIKNVSEIDLNDMQFLLKEKENLNKSLNLMGQLYDYQLQTMYPNWNGYNYLTLEQKEFFVIAEEYYGKIIKPEDFSNPPRRYSKEEQKEIILSLYQIYNNHVDSNISHESNNFLREKYPDFQIDNHSYIHMFYHECLQYKGEIGEDRINQLHRVFDIKFGHVDELFSKDLNCFTSPVNPSGSSISDFFSILESAVREADRKWREDEFEKHHKHKKKRQRGMDR